jgi:hypothetical protein
MVSQAGRRAPWRAAWLAAAGGALATAVLAGCGLAGPSGGSPPAAPTSARASAGGASPAAGPSIQVADPHCLARYRGFSCPMRERIAAVEQFLRTRPGMIGIVLRDRTTGAVWRNRYAGRQIYLASTSKLGIAVTLLEQNRAGAIHLSGSDWAQLHQMLHVSSDSAADALWFKYGATFFTSFFPRIGLSTVHYLPMAGVNGPYWGEVTGTPDDLDRLINYVLTAMPGGLRGYLVSQLRQVGTVQHFGVWGAGPANQPGNKDGWSVEQPGWIINSVGFAGPGAQDTLTMMNSLEGQGNYADGTDTVTQVAAILFQGHQIPAPTLQATP